MAPSIVHLPNGQTLTVSPVFGGLGFKANDLHIHHNVFPPGWTIILNSEDDEEDHHMPTASQAAHTIANRAVAETIGGGGMETKHHIHRFRKPSLRNDHLFISSISNPSSNDFKPASSPTRQIAMMLWASLWWYFHQPEPDPHLLTPASANTPEEGRPQGEWRVNINREGIFKGKHLLPKLERMGLISSDDSTVGLDPEDGVRNAGEGWTRMYVSRRSFWQLDARIYLFSLAPTTPGSPFPSVSPASSRPASPSRRPDSQNLSMTRADDTGASPFVAPTASTIGGAVAPLLSRHNTPPGPFTSSSHLPTFYPPPPLQYTFTNNIRHPVRPKPPRQGETFYTRYIPSLGQYLSFRVASLSRNPCTHRGPVSSSAQSDARFGRPDQTIPTVAGLSLNHSDGRATPPHTGHTERFPSVGNVEDTAYMTDTELLNKWMNDPRVAYSWGEQGPQEHQADFLSNNLTSRHSFPVIGSFDGKPFGYFEIYWVKEDNLARYIGDSGVGDYDRGVHCLVGEQEFRGRHRVKVWLSALVHYCFLADLRTETVFMEPRVDNTKLLDYSKDAGFVKTGEVSFPHKQSNLLKARRENWESPAI